MAELQQKKSFLNYAPISKINSVLGILLQGSTFETGLYVLQTWGWVLGWRTGALCDVEVIQKYLEIYGIEFVSRVHWMMSLEQVLLLEKRRGLEICREKYSNIRYLCGEVGIRNLLIRWLATTRYASPMFLP